MDVRWDDGTSMVSCSVTKKGRGRSSRYMEFKVMVMDDIHRHVMS